ncbi:clathrin adaptor, mu subunit [Rhizodiscina lignyota]|uniref:Clathrin adaptor, mu subunit n=1 Tax=Rhizodiscina lignyota TaxID=1504668 RepID=A0A9P4IGP2_9PEZI|nr:clathrin adaptor, mu subunit [Rhizodiscina lignyota]
MSQLEALYIFDEHNNPILEHVWNGRPPSAKTVLPLYLGQAAPRPSLIYLTETNPPSLLFSIIQDRLLFLSPSSSEIEPLLVLEFLHRVADALEDFLGAPLVASKIEASYDVVAQLLGEMCDAGMVDKTEPNALRDVVEAPSRMGKFLEGVGLPSSAPTALSSTPSPSLAALKARPTDTPAIPWRRSNVRHTSNELYVDMVETLSVIVAPSGRPLTARANGTIAFTAKVSGIPELLLQLNCPGGKMNMEHTLQVPVFHPCVRLTRWRERPGDLSFVPPDGRFVLAGYEVDLLGKDYLEQAFSNPKFKPDLRLPASVEVRTGLGDARADFEVRLSLNTRFATSSSSGGIGSGGAIGLGGPSGLAARAQSGTSTNPVVEDIVVTVPVPSGVRNITDLRASRGEASYSPGDGGVEWRISQKDVASMGSTAATLRCSVVGPLNDEDDEANGAGLELRAETWEYDDTTAYPTPKEDAAEKKSQSSEDRNAKKAKQNTLLMPTSAAVSFAVKGWLASGIKVEKLNVDGQRSRGIGAGVQPYKGVKYLTVSRKGVETRC